MKILMLLEHDFPPDERVQKEIKSLLSVGITVDIACTPRTNKPSQESIDGYTVYRKTISTFMYKSQAAALILPFYFGFWDSFLKELFAKNSYDCIHVHDLPLSKVAFKYAKKYNLKLVCDQHEYYSDWIVKTAHYNTFLGKIVKALSNWAKYEKKYLGAADRVITVEEPLRKCYIEVVGIPPEKTIVLSNTPARNTFTNNNIDLSIVDKYTGKQVIVYAGNIDILRGLDLIIQSLPLIEKEIPNILFVVVGKLNDSYNPMETARRHNATHLIDMVGWVPMHILPSYLAASKICLHTPPSKLFVGDNTIATKIYQYASMGKPIIVSSVTMMKKFIEENHLGYSVSDYDYEGLSKVVIKILRSEELQNEFSMNCKAVADKFVWEETSKDFVNYYKSIS